LRALSSSRSVLRAGFVPLGAAAIRHAPMSAAASACTGIIGISIQLSKARTNGSIANHLILCRRLRTWSPRMFQGRVPPRFNRAALDERIRVRPGTPRLYQDVPAQALEGGTPGTEIVTGELSSLWIEVAGHRGSGSMTQEPGRESMAVARSASTSRHFGLDRLPPEPR
jgi:hypothetical protein